MRRTRVYGQGPCGHCCAGPRRNRRTPWGRHPRSCGQGCLWAQAARPHLRPPARLQHEVFCMVDGRYVCLVCLAGYLDLRSAQRPGGERGSAGPEALAAARCVQAPTPAKRATGHAQPATFLNLSSPGLSSTFEKIFSIVVTHASSTAGAAGRGWSHESQGQGPRAAAEAGACACGVRSTRSRAGLGAHPHTNTLHARSARTIVQVVQHV